MTKIEVPCWVIKLCGDEDEVQSTTKPKQAKNRASPIAIIAFRIDAAMKKPHNPLVKKRMNLIGFLGGVPSFRFGNEGTRFSKKLKMLFNIASQTIFPLTA